MAELTVTTGGVELHVEVDGPESATSLALINPARSNLGVHTPILERLAREHRVIRHDWRGTGRSSGGERADYNFPQYADDLAAVLDAVGAPTAIICGCAYGARTAARFALRHPQRTSLLALFDVSLDQPVDQRLQRDLMLEARRLREEAGIGSPELDRGWFAHTHEREALRSLTAHNDQPDPTPELAELSIPTLVACGVQDANLEEARRIAALVPDAELHEMPMTSHPAVMSRPDLMADLLLDFIRRRG